MNGTNKNPQLIIAVSWVLHWLTQNDTDQQGALHYSSYLDFSWRCPPCTTASIYHCRNAPPGQIALNGQTRQPLLWTCPVRQEGVYIQTALTRTLTLNGRFLILKTFEHEAMYGTAWKVNSSLVNWCWIGPTLWQSQLAARPQLPMVCICGLAQDAYWAGLNSPLASLAPFSLLDWCLW